MKFSTSMQVQDMEQNRMLLILSSVKVLPLHQIYLPRKLIPIFLGLFWKISIISKKGKELFGNRAHETVMAELSEIDGLETYEPQRIGDLSYKD